jgi:hypothetical protein
LPLLPYFLASFTPAFQREANYSLPADRGQALFDKSYKEKKKAGFPTGAIAIAANNQSPAG